MEDQKVFATAWRGFEKKAVLDYIYEQDVLAKRREAELSERISEYEAQVSQQEFIENDEQPSELYQERIEQLEQSCNEQRETAELLQEQCMKLRREADQLVQMARSKDGELQLQTELNRQLQQKCDMLEGKLKTLAEHLLAEREAVISIKPLAESTDKPALEAEVETVAEDDLSWENVQDIQSDADTEGKTDFTDLKDELNDFRQSVSQTLLNFEAALARLEADTSFFH